MNRGLLEKSLREIMVLTFVCAGAIFLFELLFTAVMGSFQNQISAYLLQLEFMQRILSALLGADLGGELGPRALASMAWVHPVLLTLFWAHEITCCTRMPAGEVDRGTVDVLFALPVPRWKFLACDALIVALAGATLVACALLGSAFGTWITPEAVRYSPRVLLIIATNLLFLYLAVAGITYLCSTLNDRRGRAIGTALGIVLLSFLLNFLTQLWPPARAIGFLGLLEYHQPLAVASGGGWPVGNLAVLLGVAVLTFVSAAWVLGRRDVCTV